MDGEVDAVDAATWNLVLFLVLLLCALGCARYYVLAVLNEDRLLSRSAAAAFLIFGLGAVIFFLRIF